MLLSVLSFVYPRSEKADNKLLYIWNFDCRDRQHWRL